MPVRKRFGQHFLHDPGVIRRIIDTVAPQACERIVEVGPGRGALTWGLLERAKRLDVIEIDRDLAQALQADPRAKSGLHVHVENVLDTDFIRLEHAIEMFELIPNAQLAVLPGTTHMQVMSDADRLLSLVRPFLDGG